jgi:hypothetical protein
MGHHVLIHGLCKILIQLVVHMFKSAQHTCNYIEDDRMRQLR